MIIIESLLNENMADGEGGAIINYDKLDIVRSIFCENRAQFGGVIRNSNELTIIESTFNGNDAGKYGGVICNRSKINIEESSFSENRAEEDGGVIFNYTGEISIADSKFNNNGANVGGALYNRKKLDIERCVFDSNYSNNDGGAIANADGTIEIQGSVFKENSSKNGGGIFNNNFLTIYGSNFEKNISTSKKYSQDICNEGIIEFKENNFGEDNLSILNENAMYLNENDVNLTQKIVNNGVFHDTSPLSENQFNFTYLNNLIRGDSEIVLQGDIVLDLFNKEDDNLSAGIVIREDNVVIDGNGHSIDAKGKMRVFTLFGNNIVLKNIIIKNGFASEGGGIYKKTGNLTIKNSYLTHNVSNNDGGAIFSQGGEIYIEKTTFEYNSAKSYGGAIINNRVMRIGNEGYSSVMCVDSIFKNNVAKYGGAIYNYKTKTEIQGCEFINNRCMEDGLNISQSHSSVLLIQNSSFINDLVEMNSIDISDGNCTCKKCKFKFNENRTVLIHNHNGILRLIEPIFEDLNNSTNLNSEKLIYNGNILEIFLEDNLKEYIESGFESEIIYLDSYLLSDSKNFTQLNAILRDSYESYEILLDNDFVLEHPERDFFEGGIELDHQKLILDGQGHTINANGLSRIFLITGGDITLKNIKFENGTCFKNPFNTDIVNGGAINVLYKSSLKIINCEFNNNISQNSAGAISNKWKLSLINTKFLNNVAEYDGGSISNYQNASLDVNNCAFDDKFQWRNIN